MVILDGSITVVNIAGVLLFDVHADFSIDQCYDDPQYVVHYIVVNLVSSAGSIGELATFPPWRVLLLGRIELTSRFITGGKAVLLSPILNF